MLINLMANKFLGLDSVNVLKKYIDEQIIERNASSNVVTINAYRYYTDSEKDNVCAPAGGGFDVSASRIEYPDANWNSLQNALKNATGKDNPTIEDIEDALSVGAIYTSIGVIAGSSATEWSTPVKISGQNGIGVQFAWSHSDLATESQRTTAPSGVDVNNRVEYVWTKTGDNDWVGPTIWAMYSQDASDVLWRYTVTDEESIDENGNPIPPAKPGVGNNVWANNIATLNLSQAYPYMWMSYKLVPAGQDSNNVAWTDPVLFGHWGKDGNVPDYTQNIYCKGIDDMDNPDLPGLIAPAQPEFVEKQPVEYYLTNGWSTLPTDDGGIWWQCTLMVDGHKSIVTEVGPVKRYNAVDGVAKPGQYTKYFYRWSETQLAPDLDMADLVDGWKPKDWNETPDADIELANHPEASLWMITATIDGISDAGVPNVTIWSETPVRISGPRGPISFDYRIETRYMRGTASAPQYSPDTREWSINVPATTTDYQYVWAKPYLVYYTMKYADKANEDGSYDVVLESNSPTIVKAVNGNNVDYGYFRLSGLNGEDGSKRNSLHYSPVDTAETEVVVKSFSDTNLYVANSNVDVTYKLELDILSFVTGYTGKFANIGTANMIITATNSISLLGSNNSVQSITLAPQETIELVCYKEGDLRALLVIGKAL